MAGIEIVDGTRKKVGDVVLDDSVLNDKINKAILHQAVRRHLASRHHGTVGTKTRADVLRTNKKVYRQKGTGNARHGSRKTAPFVGGGRVFGPHPRDYNLGMPKKARRLAVREALRCRIIDGQVTIVEKIPIANIKTKDAVKFFAGLGIQKGLVVLEGPSEVIEKSARNIEGLKIIRADEINVFDLLKFPNLVFTSKAFGVVSERYLA